jgi:hypothetical protein
MSSTQPGVRDEKNHPGWSPFYYSVESSNKNNTEIQVRNTGVLI